MKRIEITMEKNVSYINFTFFVVYITKQFRYLSEGPIYLTFAGLGSKRLIVRLSDRLSDTYWKAPLLEIITPTVSTWVLKH